MPGCCAAPSSSPEQHEGGSTYRVGAATAFGPSTIQPVVAASRLPDQLKDQVREVLVTLAGDPAARPMLVYGLIDRFAPVGDGAYDDIRAMLATIKAAGWTSLDQTTIQR